MCHFQSMFGNCRHPAENPNKWIQTVRLSEMCLRSYLDINLYLYKYIYIYTCFHIFNSICDSPKLQTSMNMSNSPSLNLDRDDVRLAKCQDHKASSSVMPAQFPACTWGSPRPRPRTLEERMDGNEEMVIFYDHVIDIIYIYIQT